MTYAHDVREALAPVVPQDPHPYLDTAAGTAAIAKVADRVGGAGVRHLRTSEYVVATLDLDGRRLLARAGAAPVTGWHAEELQIAQLWANAGARVAASLTTDLHHVAGASVSLWPFLEHDPDGTCDPFAAGRLLAHLHDIGRTAADVTVFTARGFRAPGKVGRRLVALAETVTGAQAQTLVAAARQVSLLTEELSAAGTTIHGDFQPGNWLATAAGPVAVDFATSCWGPALWDLTLLEGRCGPGRRYGAEFWVAFCAGYGVQPDVLDGTAEQRLRTIATHVAGLRHGTPRPERWDALAASARS